MTDWRRLVLLVAAIKAFDAARRVDTCDTCGAELDDDTCSSCARRRQADIDHLLEPPPRIGYGYATDDDLRRQGINRHAEREAQLRTWLDDLRSAVEVGLITREQKNAAVRRAQITERRRVAA